MAVASSPLPRVETMKALPVALLVVLAFVAGFAVAWVVKPSPVRMISLPGYGSSAPVEPLPAENPGGAVDYKPIAEVLAAENVALEEALGKKTGQNDFTNSSDPFSGLNSKN